MYGLSDCTRAPPGCVCVCVCVFWDDKQGVWASASCYSIHIHDVLEKMPEVQWGEGVTREINRVRATIREEGNYECHVTDNDLFLIKSN